MISFFIGVHASGRIKGKVKNFYIAGNIIPFWVLALSLTGQAIEMGGTQDNATFAISSGFWAGAILPIGIGMSLLILGFFFAKPLHDMKLMTLPDFYFRKFGKWVELLASIISVTGMIILLAGNLAGIGILLNYALGVDPIPAMIVIAVIVMIYTTAGGLFAVTWNDVLHVSVMFIGFTAALVWIIANNDTSVLVNVISEKFSWEPFYKSEQGALLTWASLLALALGDVVALDFMERIFAAKTADYARKSCLLSGGITIFVGIAFALLGIMATLYIEDGATGNVFLNFVRDSLPVGIGTMVFMGLIAACISTLDGATMACSTVITKNIIQSQFPNLVPKRQLLFFSRFACLPVTIIAIIIAIINPVPGDLLILAFDVVFAGLFVPLTLGIYWKKSNKYAALISIIVASTARIILQFVIPEDLAGLATLIPPVLSLITFVSISLFLDKKTLPENEVTAYPARG